MVLVLPFLMSWQTATGNSRISLSIYILVVVGSGALSAWYLLIDPKWRFGSQTATGAGTAVVA